MSHFRRCPHFAALLPPPDATPVYQPEPELTRWQRITHPANIMIVALVVCMAGYAYLLWPYVAAKFWGAP